MIADSAAVGGYVIWALVFLAWPAFLIRRGIRRRRFYAELRERNLLADAARRIDQ